MTKADSDLVGRALRAQAYMLQSAEAAEAGYKKKRKRPGAQGPKTYDPDAMARAWERRSENVPTSPEEYARLKAAMPEFYRAGDSMLHGVRGIPLALFLDKCPHLSGLLFFRGGGVSCAALHGLEVSPKHLW